MNVASFAKVAALVVGAATVFALATLWSDSPWSGEGCEGDCFVVLSKFKYLVKIVVSIIALVLVAAATAKIIKRRKVLAAALACAASGAVAVFILSCLVAYTLGAFHGPDPVVLIAVSAVAGIVGALAAWCVSRWWPNTSLERTREG